VTVDRGDAILTLEVQPGPKYRVRHIEIDGKGEVVPILVRRR
jgi:outer membrane protein assembly factor BamA